MDDLFSWEGDSLNDVLGNDECIAELRKFAADVKRGERRRPILIAGPPGVGKTMAAHMLAKEAGWNVIEMSASDYRNKEAIDKMLTAASQSRGLFGGRNVILLDEIDELAGKYDKGASTAISPIIRNSKNPIILIANDRWAQSISFLRMQVDNVDFKKLFPLTIAEIVKRFVKRTGVQITEEMVDAISHRANGDARSAINDAIVLNGAPAGAVDIIGLRDKKTDVFATLDKIFFSNTYSAPLNAMASADVDSKPTEAYSSHT